MTAMPQVGSIFDPRPTCVEPLPTAWPLDVLFPSSLHLAHARGSRSAERLAFLIHGLAMNEDYFGLLAPELIGRGYDVWALRLPGYAGSGAPVRALRPHIGLSMTYYAWVAASAMAHLARMLDPAPTHVLAWGHSLGGVVLGTAVTSFPDSAIARADRLVFEAPAFGEALAWPLTTVAVLAALPDGVLNTLARGMLLDDIRTSPLAAAQGSSFLPGRASRLLLTMNVLALCNPLAQALRLAREALAKSWFVLGEFDRLVDHDRLVGLLDRWGVAAERRLVLPRNHLLALTVPREMLDWVDGV